MYDEKILEKYLGVELTFSHYYKYKFTFIGYVKGGIKIVANYGGDYDDIYRFDLKNNQKEMLDGKDGWTSISIYDGKNLIYNWSDY